MRTFIHNLEESSAQSMSLLVQLMLAWDKSFSQAAVDVHITKAGCR